MKLFNEPGMDVVHEVYDHETDTNIISEFGDAGYKKCMEFMNQFPEDYDQSQERYEYFSFDCIGAMYVHDTKETPYAMQIVKRLKPIETRTKAVLDRFLKCRVLVIRTRSGHKAEVIGSVFIDKCRYLTAKEMDAVRDKTLIPAGSEFDCQNGKGKYCYYLTDPVEFDMPRPLSDYLIITRTMSYAILTSKKSK